MWLIEWLLASDLDSTYIIGASEEVEAFKLLEVTSTQVDQMVEFVDTDDPVAVFRIRVAERHASQGVFIALRLSTAPVHRHMAWLAKLLEVL